MKYCLVFILVSSLFIEVSSRTFRCEVLVEDEETTTQVEEKIEVNMKIKQETTYEENIVYETQSFDEKKSSESIEENEPFDETNEVKEEKEAIEDIETIKELVEQGIKKTNVPVSLIWSTETKSYHLFTNHRGLSMEELMKEVKESGSILPNKIDQEIIPDIKSGTYVSLGVLNGKNGDNFKLFWNVPHQKFAVTQPASGKVLLADAQEFPEMKLKSFDESPAPLPKATSNKSPYEFSNSNEFYDYDINSRG